MVEGADEGAEFDHGCEETFPESGGGGGGRGDLGEAGEELWFDENYGDDALVVAEEETAHGCEDGAEGDVAGGEDAAEAGFTVWLAGLG